MRECQHCYGSGHGKPNGHTGRCLRRGTRTKREIAKKRTKVPRQTKPRVKRQIVKKRVTVSRKTKPNQVKDNKSAQIEKTTPEIAPETKFENFMLGGSLYLHISGAPNSGLGVFTRKIIRKGQIITKFEGKKIDSLQFNDLKTTRNNKLKYVFYWNKQSIFLGSDTPEEGKGLGSFINNGGKNKVGDNNCELCVKEGQVFVRTTKDINSYHELFMAYGSGYDFT
jgi:hypothetical protein